MKIDIKPQPMRIEVKKQIVSSNEINILSVSNLLLQIKREKLIENLFKNYFLESALAFVGGSGGLFV